MGGRELSSIRQISNFTQANTLPMKAKLKVPRRLSNKKDPGVATLFKKN
jgi:hypothetical protein